MAELLRSEEETKRKAAGLRGLRPALQESYREIVLRRGVAVLRPYPRCRIVALNAEIANSQKENNDGYCDLY